MLKYCYVLFFAAQIIFKKLVAHHFILFTVEFYFQLYFTQSIIHLQF